jgi:hypothetical protein
LSIDKTGSSLFDTYFGTLLASMYSGIESTMKKESTYSCALLLSSYTEVIGGIISGNLKDPSSGMRKNYETFLEYLGGHYVALNQKYDLYTNVRNKLVHEFILRRSHWIIINEKPTQGKFGIEVINGNLIFNLQEYYRDFKNGVEKYRGGLGEQGMSIINFVKALQTEWDEVTYKPKETLKDKTSQELEQSVWYVELALEQVQNELKQPHDNNDFFLNQIKEEQLNHLKIMLKKEDKPAIKERMKWLQTNMPVLYSNLISIDLIKKYLSP